uniref:Peptidyl-prolyl cis-trans isomerase n=1 Tax=Eutreptiella gymnastica TaxID=73025 RepID=A0A7S1JD20_9EUGL|mmetsp:Transcript_82652/g.145783  ORF Transcript_82652/g.145783 Transcript_82652/m.145783 type:complete len:115 (+) Transcript_82652:28-372(+)
MPDQVRCSHLLIKHIESRNPVSRRTGQQVTLTKAEAIAELKGYEEAIKSGKADFFQEAAKRSDCSSYRNGGDLGPFGRNEMQKPFEEASFALQVNEMSGIVDTDSGVHLIVRTG